MIWIMLKGDSPEILGFLPSFLDEGDPRSAKEQFDANYISGWIPFEGFTMSESGVLSYPGDPDMEPLAVTTLRDETIIFYPHAWVVVKQKDGTFEACRMD